MESLAYTEMAAIYEESVGDLELPSIAFKNPLRLQKMISWAAILAAILLGGLTAVVSTAFSDVNTPPGQQQIIQK
jgi:hypothetical protein